MYGIYATQTMYYINSSKTDTIKRKYYIPNMQTKTTNKSTHHIAF